MKEIEILAGSSIEGAWEELRKCANENNEVCKCSFNGNELYSSDTLDEAYKKVTGKTKAEFDKAQQEWLDDYNRREEEFKATIPSKSEEYKNRARGLILSDKYELWDKIVPIRLGDLYNGMELEQTLQACEIMRDEKLSYEKRLRKAYKVFMDCGHSGMSAALTASMYKEFVPNGIDLADAVMNFKFEKD